MWSCWSKRDLLRSFFYSFSLWRLKKQSNIKIICWTTNSKECERKTFLQIVRQVQRRFDELALPLRSNVSQMLQNKFKRTAVGCKKSNANSKLSTFRSDSKIKSVTNLSQATLRHKYFAIRPFFVKKLIIR